MPTAKSSLESWLERNAAPVRASRRREQSSVLSPCSSALSASISSDAVVLTRPRPPCDRTLPVAVAHPGAETLLGVAPLPTRLRGALSRHRRNGLRRDRHDRRGGRPALRQSGRRGALRLPRR